MFDTIDYDQACGKPSGPGSGNLMIPLTGSPRKGRHDRRSWSLWSGERRFRQDYASLFV